MLVVVRDVEKESEIESEGLQKKAIFFFRKRVFAFTKIAKIACVRYVRCMRCVRCVCCVRFGFSGLHLFFPVVGVLG